MKRRYLSTLAGTMAAAMMVCGGTVFAEETPGLTGHCVGNLLNRIRILAVSADWYGKCSKRHGRKIRY